MRRVLGFVLLRGEEVVSVRWKGRRFSEENFAEASAEGGGIPGGGVARPAGRGAPMMMPGMMPPPGLGQQQPSSGPPGMMMPPPGFRPGMGPQ